MSIPPLVCSTPPPPDQCEEDKDPEDFDISYNLSQDDDDDDDYNFGNFSSYTNIQPSADINIPNVLNQNVGTFPSCEVKQPIEVETIKQYPKDEHHNGSNITTPDKVKCEEDTNIEDLELEISEESIENSMKIDNEASSLESSNSEINVENEDIEDIIRTLSPSLTTEDNSVESLSIEDKKQVFGENALESPHFELDASTEPHKSSNSLVKQDLCTETKESENTTEHKEETNDFDDDFGDFDDLQFTGTENQPLPIINTCNNPWESNETENDGFGNFTANFEAIEEIHIESDPITEIKPTEDQGNDEFQDAAIVDDDFGDFDDFKSSAGDNGNICESENTASNEQGPGINFYLSDNESQVMESITNVLESIFEEEVMEPDTAFEGTLETMLSETWRHLRETDVRQPYIVNWNNSLGQKTLLRALCIDSRNILFGPKWSYNMPKYAVNLSNAPLQPRKPLAPSSSQTDTGSSEKIATKPGGWVDPFANDGQESCNTESESVVEVTSSDLDVFEAAISTKPDKIYSSTLNVQPLRQINLPDTHIFTPTDSETPRSKTIHYDSGPPVLLPQPVLESTKAVESYPPQKTEKNDDDDNDDEDWEFQDFKGSSGGTVSAPQPKEQPLELKPENISKPNVNYQTQVLQPIKMEPLMPSLNWPDPGEVKETFEDFSDFVSKTSWNNEQPHISTFQDSKGTLESNSLENISDRLTMNEIQEKEILQPVSQTKSEGFNDEFDTFKSALPSKISMGDLVFDSLSRNTFNNIPNHGAGPSINKDFNCTFPTFNSNKSDTISVDNTTRPNEALTQSLGFIPIPELTTNKNSLPLGNPMSSYLLQPLPVSCNATQKHKKTAQILQPLSLESYSQINWPNPGIDLQDLSRFNPVETLQSLKTELSAGAGGPSKGASPVHLHKNAATKQAPDDDIWGDFVSSKPKQTLPKKAPVFADDDEWTDFVSSPSATPQNGLNTISLNVHTSSNIQKSSNINKFASKNSKAPLDIPTLNYITPKSSGHNAYNERHFQNL